MTAQEIARAIEYSRYERGITQVELCRRAGVTYCTYWRAQDGQGIHFDTLNAIVEAAGFEIILQKKEEEE